MVNPIFGKSLALSQIIPVKQMRISILMPTFQLIWVSWFSIAVFLYLFLKGSLPFLSPNQS